MTAAAEPLPCDDESCQILLRLDVPKFVNVRQLRAAVMTLEAGAGRSELWDVLVICRDSHTVLRQL